MASSHERVNFFSDARANRVRSAARLLKARPKRDALVRYSDRVGEASGKHGAIASRSVSLSLSLGLPSIALVRMSAHEKVEWLWSAHDG